MSTFYIDSLCGDDANDGLSETNAKATYKNLALSNGDTVLLRTGTEYRDALTVNVSAIKIGSYGDGDMPKITLCTQRSAPYLWGADGKNVYKLLIKSEKEPKNVIFDFGAYAGERVDFQPHIIGQWQTVKHEDGYELRIYSDGSPTAYYRDIEITSELNAALTICGDTEISNINFFGTAGTAVSLKSGKVTMHDCRFEYIGTPGDNCSCLEIYGSAEISECAFIDTYAPAVHIFGSASDVNIVSNTFTSFADCGILCDGVEKAMIELNVFDPASADKYIASVGAKAPIEINSGSDITVRRNIFRKLHNPIISDCASVTVENNEKQ